LLCDRGGAVIERFEPPLLRLLPAVLRLDFEAVKACSSLPQSIALAWRAVRPIRNMLKSSGRKFVLEATTKGAFAERAYRTQFPRYRLRADAFVNAGGARIT